MLAGGIFGAFFTVKNSFRSVILHLAAGVIFAVVAIELMPKVLESHMIPTITIGFFSGLIVMLLIKYLSGKASERQIKPAESGEKKASILNLLPWGLLVGIAVDIFLDGMLVGVGFAAGESEGLLLSIALSIEILALGLVVSTELKSAKFKPKTILLVISALSVSILLGALIGSILLNYVGDNVLTGVLAFGLSALMYLVTEELLVEAHEHKDTPFYTAVFFIGFFVFLLIAMVN